MLPSVMQVIPGKLIRRPTSQLARLTFNQNRADSTILTLRPGATNTNGVAL